MKTRGIGRSQLPGLPQDVGAGECGMAAQRHFHRGGEPAQAPAFLVRVQKRRLGQVHFLSDPLHPALLPRRRHKADGGGIARERLVGESINLIDRVAHGSFESLRAGLKGPAPTRSW